MARRDLSSQYVGSILGFVWTFINPLVMIFVFWVVFSVGFKVTPLQDVPFVVWLCAGMAAWFVFADIVSGSTQVITANVHLIKKTLFPSQILPIVKVVSSLITHSIFLFILICLLFFQKVSLTLYALQFFYYLFCLVVLALGLGWALAALNVFIRDIGQMVTVILQIGFWATPVFWDINIMPPGVQTILKYNPLFYIVQGYRDSFLYATPFWSHPVLTIYFWAVTITVFVLGAMIFRKLKPQFPDVL